jgi:PAS domain S-box-containing protein
MANASMGRIVGLAPDRFDGQTPFDFLHPDDVSRARDVLARTIAGNTPPTPQEFRLVHVDGSTRTIEATLTNLLDDPTVAGIIVNYHDVTKRKRAEQALAASEQHRSAVLAAMINAEEQARRRIAGEIHDDTIQAITAALFALDQITSAARRGDVATVSEVSTIARTTLQAAAERARRMTFELRPPVLDMHGLTAAIEQLARQAEQAAGFTVTLNTELGRHPEPVETLVYRTIREALLNVRKHAHANNVTITARERHDHIDVEVQDDGRGFDPDTVATMPSHGVQLHFGIDTSRERIRLAQGTWQLRSKPGHGTKLRFSVPLADGTATGRPSP